MTTPTAFSKLQKLLWLGVKPRYRDGVRPITNTAVITDDLTATIEVFTDSSAPIEYPAGYVDMVRISDKFDSDCMVAIRTDFLKEIINAIDSDCVRFYYAPDNALKICGSVGDVNVIARIAPRIDMDDYSDELYYTDTSPAVQQKNSAVKDTVPASTEGSDKAVIA